MPYDLTTFGLGDMLKSSPRLRETATAAPTFESSADRFKTLALDVKSGFSRYNDTNIFNQLRPSTGGGARPQ